MRVVGPTIVEPWRARGSGGEVARELLEVRHFGVPRPRPGVRHGTVAFRELHRLDSSSRASASSRPRRAREGEDHVGVTIKTSSFFIDINPFAVELAKVTLNIAKKIAFDERREVAADLVGQMGLDVDPSPPLDNLDKNIVCADALFTDWPNVDAIVGNPPFLGGSKIRQSLDRNTCKESTRTWRGYRGYRLLLVPSRS